MEIKRNYYLNMLICHMNNGMIKVITGIRRCGKSYFLFKIFYEYLISIGVDKNHIIKIALDDRINKKYRDPDVLCEYIHSQIHLFPLSFAEFCSATNKTITESYKEYLEFGGLPKVLEFTNIVDKTNYLKSIVEETYLKDIKEKNNIKSDFKIAELLDILASSIGSLTNPKKMVDTFKSVKQVTIHPNTIKNYLDYFVDSFIVSQAKRYDIKGKKYINSPFKDYFTDLGLKNARLNFR